MPEGERATPIAIVGLACRFPDADDPLALFESTLAGRRSFRRLPPGRSGGPAGGQLPRAALLEGWQFSRAEFGITEAAYRSADPAHWLALETAGRALADAGFPGGQGAARDRAGVIIGNTLTGEVSRAAALHTQWPFVATVLAGALAAGDVPLAGRPRVLGHAARAFAAPFPEPGPDTLAGGQPGAIADRICQHFGFRGGGHAVDTAHSSALLAVATGCAFLATGELDFVLAGGVDISLDLFELGGLARAGQLATGPMRIYDTAPTGFLPGEGCGIIALMRASDARAADMPSYADILGWGVSSAGPRHGQPAGQLLALQRAYQRAGVQPGDVQFIEGDGRGTADGDLAELAALTTIRAGAAAAAALGSVKANIGHGKAAAGAAGLIKTALAVNAGVIPPVTGCIHPHPLLSDAAAVLRVPRTAESWPGRIRLAAVSSIDPAGAAVHLVLRRERNLLQPAASLPPSGPRTAAEPPGAMPPPGPLGQPSAGRHPGRGQQPGLAQPVTAGPRGRTLASWSVPTAPRAEAFTFSAPDRATLAARLSELAAAAPGLSDGELSDLACQSGRQAGHGPVRVALVASHQEELARLSRAAADLLPSLSPGQLLTRPGLFAADRVAGRVALLFPGEATATAAGPGRPGVAAAPAIAQLSLNALHWLDRLGLRAAAGVGQGVGEITALVWSGSLAEPAAARLIGARAAALSSAAGPPAALLCLAADAETALSWPAARELVIAGYYGPRCHLVAGPVPVVQQVARSAAQAGIQGRVLDLPYALHSPAMAGPAAALGEVLAGAEFAAPGRRLFSAVTGQEVTAGTDIRGLLREQITAPVRLAEALRAVAAEADLLLDTGPGQAMAGLAAGCATVPAVSLAAGPDSAAAPAVAAALFAAGAVASLEPLLAGRPARHIDLGRPRVFITNPCAEAVAAAGGPAADGPAADGAPGATVPAGQVAADQAGPGQAEAYPGVGRWARCFTEELRPPHWPAEPVDEEPWRLRATTRQPFGRMAAEVFEDDPAATGVLAVIGDLADPDGSGTLVAAARDAAAAGSLVVITPAAGLAGFCASLHAEHPSLGITLIRTADSMDGLLAAQRFAATEPGRFRELVLDGRGEPREPVMAAAAQPRSPGRAGLPGRAPGQPPTPVAGIHLDQTDVVLVSGARLGDIVATAGLLADGTARLALVAGPAGPDEAAAADRALAALRRTGTAVSYATADLSDPDEAEAVVASIEHRVGPVTAVFHTASGGPRARCAELPDDEVRALISAQAEGLANLLGAITAVGLRLLVTASALPARYGAAWHGAAALAATALAEQARRLAPGLPGCRVLHADLPWPPGTGPAAPAELGGLLLSALPRGEGAARVAIHGRLGPAATRPGGPGPGGRFLETLRVHYPGVELVAEARVSARTDPYLAGYLADGLAMLPPAIGLEAMAQAAAALAGRPLRELADVSMEAPVVLPPGGRETTLRVCALVRDDSVETVLRTAGTSFHVDHFRAFFPLQPGTLRDGPHWGSEHRDSEHRDAPGGQPGGTAGRGRGLGLAAPGAGRIVDGTDVYGPVCFQAGPFRRVAFLPEVTARSCRALIRGADDRAWFTGPSARPGSMLILGSPGLNDAVMHVLQACVPDRRVLPAGFGSFIVAGQEVRGAVQVRAERAAGPAGSWQVTALDATGLAVLTLTGLRLRAAGNLAPAAPWHPTLLAAAIEGRGAELGLDPVLRVEVRCWESGPGDPGAAGGLPWTAASAGAGPLAGFELTARASMPVACHWETIGPPAAVAAPAGLARQLHERHAEQPDTVSGRLRAITACLAAAGWADGTPVQLAATRDADWTQVRAGKITVACTVAVIDGVSQPVAIALATWSAGDKPAASGPASGGHSGTRRPGTRADGPPGRPPGPGGSLGRPSVLS